LWVLDRAAGLERAVLMLCFGAADNLKYHAGHVLGRGAALPVDDQRGKRVVVVDDDWEIVREPSDDIVEECGSAVIGNPAFDKRHLADGEQNFL
jgi:hypothetical protein